MTKKEMPLTSNEYKIIQAVKGDLQLAELIVKELQKRVQAVVIANYDDGLDTSIIGK